MRTLCPKLRQPLNENNHPFEAGLSTLTMLVAGSMIGRAFSFAISADIARLRLNGMAGCYRTSALTVDGGFSYGDGRAFMMPRQEGQNVYLREAANPLFGFLRVDAFGHPNRNDGGGRGCFRALSVCSCWPLLTGRAAK